MNIILLKDLTEGETDAVIISDTTTAEEIEKKILEAKENNDEYQFEDLVNALPSDCKIHTVWSGNVKTAWY